MRPTLALGNTSSMYIADTESPTKLFVTDALLGLVADGKNIGHGEFGHATILAVMGRVLMPAFLHHVLYIVGICASKQVVRIAAAAIVAMVAYMMTFWNWAVMNFVGYAMSALQGATVTAAKLTIARVIDMTLPFPTLVKWASGYMFPKHFFGGTTEAMTFAKACVLSFDQVAFVIGTFGYGRDLAASTFAEFWCVRGIIEAHQNLQFWRLIRRRGDTRRPVLSRSLLVQL